MFSIASGKAVFAINKQLRHVSNLVLFARIVQAGGISRCANALGIERTTVSRRLQGLEQDMGVELLRRSPRKITPTRAGRRCFARCVEILDLVTEIDVLGAVGKKSSHATKVSIAATPDVVDNFLEPRLVAFEKEHPKVNVRRILYSGVSPIPLEKADLLVAWKSKRHDPSLVRPLGSVKQALYASPAYLSRNGCPETPADLCHHTPILERAESDAWSIQDASKTTRIRSRAALVTQDLLECRESAIAGFGVCLLPCYLGDPFVDYGRLVKLMPGHGTSDRELVTVSPNHSANRLRVTMLRVALEDSFARAPDSHGTTASQPVP